MAGGYREDPDQALQRRQEWLDLAIAIPITFAAFAGLNYFEDVLVTSLGLGKIDYTTIRNIVCFVVLFAMLRLLESRRLRRLPRS